MRLLPALLLILFTTGQAAAAPLDRIEELRLKGEHENALNLALDELEIDTENPRLLNTIGEIRFETGEIELARQRFQRAADIDGLDLLSANLNLARVHLYRGENKAALPLLREIRSSYQTRFSLDARDLYAIASATRLLGQTDPQLFKDAVRLYDEAMQRDPSSNRAGIALGELLLEKYNNQEAEQVFKQVLEQNDEDPRALLGLARSQHFDYSSEAVSTTVNALAINPRLVPARVFLARLFIELEEYADARHEAEVALEVNPVSLEALTMLAVSYFLERDLEAFARTEKRVLQINPAYAEFYAALADLAAHNRLYREAADFAARAVELDPNSWRAHGLLGLNQLRLGRMAAGRASLERSFEGDPYNVWIKNTLQLADSFDQYVEIEVGRFIVVLHDSEDALLRDYVKDLAADAYAYFSARYRHQPQQPVRLELYPDHADFSVRTVGLAGVGLLGVAFGPVVAMDSPAARQRGAFNWGSTLWHEIAHVFHLSITDNRVPRWFSEGLAVHEERRARPGWGQDVDPDFLIAYLEGRLLPVSQLNNGFVRPTYPEQVIHSYYQSSLVFEFIEQRWGFDVIREILFAYRDSPDPQAVLEKFLDIDPATLDADFEAFLQGKFAAPLAALAEREQPLPDTDPAQPPDSSTELPENYFAQMHFGNLLAEQDKPDLAALFFERAQQLFPQYAGADSSYWRLAQLYLQQEKFELAEAQLAAMVAINAEHYAAHRELAALRARRGDVSGAADALQSAVYIYPYDLELHRQLAEHAAELGDWPRAVRERGALLALDPVDRAEAFYQLARAYHRAGDRSSAREQILYALEIAPNYYQAQELLLALRAAAAQ